MDEKENKSIIGELFDQKTSETIRKFSTGAHRDSAEGKGRFDLIEPCLLRRLAARCEFGAKHYGDNNWKLGIPKSSLWDSAMRHLNQAREGYKNEDHLAGCIWNLMALMYYEENENEYNKHITEQFN